MSHTYNAEQAEYIYKMLPEFLPALQKLNGTLKKQLDLL